MSGTPRGRALALALAVALASTGCARVLYNFGEVEPERIYRSAQPSPFFLKRVLERHGIRSLINLRGDTPGFESAFAARHGLRLYSFKLRATRKPTPAQVERFLRILDDPANYPLLIHCRNGVDRTGYMVGAYRILRQGWTAERAIHEMNRYLQFEWLNSAPQEAVREMER